MSGGLSDPLEELARELRQGVGTEFKAEAEITEQETHVGFLRRLSLADAGRAAMHRGDLVSLLTSAKTITGSPVYVGKDYLTVETRSEIVDAPFDRVLIRVERRPSGGHSALGGAITFKARLSELEHSRERVTLYVAEANHEITGRVALLATDHCIVEDPEGPRVHIPLNLITMVIRPRPS